MIRMTKQADYGTMLLTYFARGGGRRMLSARDLAERARLPLPTVTKILKLLARGGVLMSHRGVKGGYSLARQPEQITIAEVITAIEGPIAITQCSENADGCESRSMCPVSPSWQRIDSAFATCSPTSPCPRLTRSSPTGDATALEDHEV